MVKVSIIVPVYGVEPYLRKCLNSIVGQTLDDIEVIVVDDGSPDGCPAIIDEFDMRDQRFHVIHKKNAGVSAARNDGLAQATGEYVFFCDSDDWLPRDALKTLFEAANAADADVAIGDYVESSNTGERELKMFSNPFSSNSKDAIGLIQRAIFNKGRANYRCADFEFARGLGAPWHHLIRRDLISSNGLEFNCRVGGLFDDGIFMLEVFESVKRVVYVQEPTYFYRVVETSITHGYKDDLLERYQRVYGELERFFEHYSKDEEFIHSYYVRVYAYLNKAMAAYFQNPANSKSFSERYALYVQTVKSEPYFTAIRELDERVLGYKKSRLLVRLLKRHMYLMYWSLKRFFSK